SPSLSLVAEAADIGKDSSDLFGCCNELGHVGMSRGNAFGKCFLERIDGVALGKHPEWRRVGMIALADSIYGMTALAIRLHEHLTLSNVVCLGRGCDESH